MSNITLFKSGSVAIPDYLRELDDTTKALAGNSGMKRISIKGGVWRMVVGGEEVAKNEDRAMNFIVVAASPEINRTFYAGRYEEGKDAQPTCWSADGKVPNAEVPTEQRQSRTCDNCPQNIAGSGEGQSRACRYSKRLAVVLENDVEGNIYQLQLPAKSLFGKPEGDKMPLQAYAKFLAGNGVPITGVVTEARFDTGEAVPVLKFRAVRPLTREEWDSARAAGATKDAQQAIEFKMVVKPAKEAGPQAAEYVEPTPAPVRAVKAAPVAEPEDDDTPAPTVRASAKSKPVVPAPVASKDPTDVLSAWGDDDE